MWTLLDFFNDFDCKFLQLSSGFYIYFLQIYADFLKAHFRWSTS